MSMGKLTTRRAASVFTLLDIKDVTQDIAERVRGAWRRNSDRRQCREAIDKLIDTHGVEHLGVHRRTGLHVYYCNAGDPYATTILFHGETMRVGCIGDLVEKNLIREENSQY